MRSSLEEIDNCRSLFLIHIQELDGNSLKLVVSEGLPVGQPESISAGGVTIPDCDRIEVSDQSGVFELVWTHYIGFTVLNESFASVADDEKYEGSRFRIYSKSRFLDYMSEATFACEEHPGSTRHYCVACEDQIIEVLAVSGPVVRRIQ